MKKGDIGMSIDFYVADVALSLCFLVALLGMLLFKSGNKSIKSFTGLMISHFVVQFFSYDIYLLFGENLLYYKLTKFIYILFEYLFFFNLLPNKKYRRFISLVFVVGTIYLAIHYLHSFSDISNSDISIIVNNTLILFSCFIYYIYMMKNISLQPLLRQWKFIIVTGFFVYALGSTGAQITSLYAFKVGLQSRDMLIMNVLIYIFELCIFFWGLWVYRAELKSNQKLKLENANVE